MKIISLLVIRREPFPACVLAQEHDLSSLGFFQRTSATEELLAFFATTIVEKTAPGVYQAIKQDVYTGYVHVLPDYSLAGVAITDFEYPQSVAFDAISKMLTAFTTRFSRLHWNQMSKNEINTLTFPQLREMIRKYQDPTEASALLKVQKSLDETRTVLTTTISALLEREEKLDSLVEKSEQISTQSKAFYKVAKRTNSCCWLQ